MSTSWMFLVAAILLEVCGTTSMKVSDGFSKIVPSVLIFFFYGLSMFCLTLAVKRIDISVAYAVWSGLGTAIVAVIGTTYFGEPLGALKVGALALIVIGVVTVNLGG
jgi:small multidrug resistance pump